jgi:hypothetical protein
MHPALESYNTKVASSGLSQSVPFPVDAAVGDILVVIARLRSGVSATTISKPAAGGWEYAPSANDYVMAMWKVATSGDLSAGAVTVSCSHSGPFCAVSLRISRVSAAAVPIEGAHYVPPTSVTTFDCPEIASSFTSGHYLTIAAVGAGDGSSTKQSVPSGYTEVVHIYSAVSSTHCSLMVFKKDSTNATENPASADGNVGSARFPCLTIQIDGAASGLGLFWAFP